jgi:hypothetical protein
LPDAYIPEDAGSGCCAPDARGWLPDAGQIAADAGAYHADGCSGQ